MYLRELLKIAATSKYEFHGTAERDGELVLRMSHPKLEGGAIWELAEEHMHAACQKDFGDAGGEFGPALLRYLQAEKIRRGMKIDCRPVLRVFETEPA